VILLQLPQHHSGRLAFAITNRRTLEEVFMNWRMRPVVVDGGTAALAELEKTTLVGSSFAVVVLDVHMPDMDGFALAQRISQDQRFAGIKLVMLTSAGEPEDVVCCRKLGISAYLTKPIKQSELFDVIVSAIREPIAEKPKLRKKSPVKQSGLRVLLAEDNQVNRLVATEFLKSWGIR
jgi:two-component system, sensor histidine kinase and response regulator